MEKCGGWWWLLVSYLLAKTEKRLYDLQSCITIFIFVPPGVRSMECFWSRRKISIIERFSEIDLHSNGVTNSSPFTLGLAKANKCELKYLLFSRATILAVTAYLDAFQKIADAATNARGELIIASTDFSCVYLVLRPRKSPSSPWPEETVTTIIIRRRHSTRATDDW